MSLVYQLGAACVRSGLRLGPLARGITWFSKVWLRHARLVGHLRRGAYDAVIDGGANVGEFAELVRDTLPAAELLCVEPHAGCAARLRRRGFQVVEAALWDRVGTLTLTQPSSATTSCTVVNKDGEGDEGNNWEVRAVRLDGLSVRGRRVFLKLDLQGAEPQALDGMGELWARCAAVLLEVSFGLDGNYEALRARLAVQGFREASTLNELETLNDGVIEADKLWVRQEQIGA